MHRPSLTEYVANLIGNKILNKAVAVRVSTLALPRPPAHLGVKVCTLCQSLARADSLCPAMCLETVISSHSTKGLTSFLHETSSS